MPCKKSQLISAINSYAAARASSDANLINMAAQMLQPLVDSLSYSPESDEPVEAETEVMAEAA